MLVTFKFSRNVERDASMTTDVEHRAGVMWYTSRLATKTIPLESSWSDEVIYSQMLQLEML